MKIQNKKITEIRPCPENPRKITNAIEGVARSIQEFGFLVPIVIDTSGEIVCGHVRFEAAKRLNLETVPCVVADDLDERKIREFRLIDNKTAEMSEWNMDKAREELAGIFTIDMTEFGFIVEEMKEFIAGEENARENEELSLEDFTGTECQHECKECGFKW